MRSGSSGYGGGRGSRFPGSNRRSRGSGSTTGPASVRGPSVRTKSPFGDCFAFICRAAGSCDFVEARTHDGRRFRTLNLIDAPPDRRLPANAVREFTRERLAIRIDRKLRSTDVIDVLSDQFMPHAASRITSGPTTAYVRKIWPLRSAGHGAFGVPNALLRLPRRALPSRNDLFHNKHRVRALAALTVLNTRSQIPSRRPEHYLRGQQAASTARQREVLPPGLTPSKKGR